MRRFMTDKYIESETQLCSVVPYVLFVASMSGQSAQQIGIAKSGAMVGSKIIMRAGEVLKDFVKTRGGVAVKELNTFCKNNLSFRWRWHKQREEKLLYWTELGDLI